MLGAEPSAEENVLPMKTTTFRVEASDGVSLYAECSEPAEPSARGLDVVFSCAYTTTGENWRGQVEPLVAAGHRVVLWDFRGHGRSAVPTDASQYTMDQVVDDLGRVLDWGAPGRAVVLVGLSFGGLTSLHFTLRSPERVRGLALIGSGPGFKNPEAAEQWRIRSGRTADYIESRGLDAFVSGKAAATCIGKHPELPAARAAAAAIAAQNPQGLARFGRLITGLVPSVIDDLARIEQPALVLVGEEDEAFLRAAQVMANKLPRAQHQLIPGAGHIVNIEAAAEFDRRLLAFLAELASDGAPEPAD